MLASMAPQGQAPMIREIDPSGLISVNTSQSTARRNVQPGLLFPVLWEPVMSRHLDNLQRLFHELRARYGEDDAIALQVKQDIDFGQAIESRYPYWSPTFRERRSGQPTERHWDAASRPST